MFRRYAFAAAAALSLAACQPAPKPVDKADPIASLTPWDAKRKDVKTTESGLQYVVVAPGDESKPAPTEKDLAEVRFDIRTLPNGDVFQSTYAEGDGSMTIDVPLTQVFPGWTEGLKLMHPGAQYVFFVPWKLGFGAEGFASVPPNTDLLVRTEMIAVKEAPHGDEAAWKKVTPWPSDSAEIRKTASGLEYYVIASGDASGVSPRPIDFVSVHYEGRLDDGTVFDSSYPRMEPAQFPVGGLIPGWVEALQMMKPGDHWILRIPAKLAYGEKGAGGQIPPNAPLTFEMELLQVHRVGDDAPPAEPAK